MGVGVGARCRSKRIKNGAERAVFNISIFLKHHYVAVVDNQVGVVGIGLVPGPDAIFV